MIGLCLLCVGGENQNLIKIRKSTPGGGKFTGPDPNLKFRSGSLVECSFKTRLLGGRSAGSGSRSISSLSKLSSNHLLYVCVPASPARVGNYHTRRASNTMGLKRISDASASTQGEANPSDDVGDVSTTLAAQLVHQLSTRRRSGLELIGRLKRLERTRLQF